jgi:hypothetical protein
MSFSDAGDVMLTSSSQNKEIHGSYSTPTTKDPPEGKTMAVIAVMRGKLKYGFHHQCSNKHFKQKLLRVLLGSDSDGDLVFVNKEKPMLFPYSTRLVPQPWNTLNGIFQTKCKARIELNFFEYSSDRKRFLNLMWSSMTRVVSLSMTRGFTHKNYTSLDKNEKKVPRVIS